MGLEAQAKSAGIKLKGFHADPQGLLQKSGIFNFTEYKELVNGLYEAKVGFLNHVKDATTTFFPKEWSIEKVAQKIIESWNNPTVLGLEGSYYRLEGLTKEGVKIRTVIRETGEIITHYPIP